ncbi:hypothetical protein FVEG_16775 [Fusarium verticillioides 7600]|uniref:DUF7719 domain-containing protein n=2 Tax=Fusarium TaxID=5506 RepID=W7MHL3_GIBM7|nr:hypothetical protein FVEG_16775 [Fusarium verticillioides 7600]XP_044675766.1 hypothetical protein J7337_011554 [Fusarium musae]RBQ72816.1 hypothetical protein FVER14953_20560 [Fusarium verticillioides]EWG51223.1 hypothetical protein FVEG_16775 [Fusarium verticillioides 7600]KAG9496766.1 hypothetical protein J7337_011554 [Fusarium musae]RBQ94867.1 hypothetical protein FVER53263_21066 [Fusarium verticillioides]RBR17751.1 hypothetical protein FVER53590_29717 [Fusarium verticillioides]
MARQRKEKSVKDIKLEQPDRSGPTKETLVDFAKGRDLFAEADRRQRELNGEGPLLSPRTERIFETILWTGVIATVHFTFDVLVQRQYAMEVDWFAIVQRTFTAWLLFIGLFYVLHPHYSHKSFFPLVPQQYQETVRQAIFFVASTVGGCYLIHISNNYGYIAVMKQAPPLGCLWVWAVVEMDILWAFPSLCIAVAYAYKNGYGFR